MKVIYKYLRVAFCFMAFALCSFMFAFAPTLTATYAVDFTATKYNVAINAIKMPTEEVDYNNEGEKFRIPLLSSAMGVETTDYKICVVDPSGYKHYYDVKTKTSDSTNFFGSVEKFEERDHLIVNAQNDGVYKIVYIVTDSGKEYYSNFYEVKVTNIKYELDFSTPVVKEQGGKKVVVGYTNNLIKPKLALVDKVDQPSLTSLYEIPVAYAKKAGEKLTINETTGVVTNEKATIKVTKDGVAQELDVTGSLFTSSEGRYFINPNEEGVFTIEYSFENSVNRPTRTFTINVEEGFVPGDLKLATTPTMPTLELGKTGISMPKISVNAGRENNVDVNVKSIVIEKESDSTIRCVLENNNFEFDMTPEYFDDFYQGTLTYEDMVGNYRVTYEVVDAYGQDIENRKLVETFKVDGVSITSKPTIRLAYNYSKTDLENVNFGAEVELKAEYEKGTSFVLPAAYIEDAVTTNFDDFTVIRTIKKGGATYYVDNKKYNDDGTITTITNAENDKYKAYFNNSGDANIGDPTKAVEFKFSDFATNVEGKYTLEYTVITKQVKERKNTLSETYTFRVSATHTKSTPTIEITNLKDSMVKDSDKIAVQVKSVDGVNEKLTENVDVRLKNAVFTYSTKKTLNAQDYADYETIKDYSLSQFITYSINNVQKSAGYEKTINILNDLRFETEMNKYYNDFKIVLESEETKNSFNLDLKGKTGIVNVVAVALNDDGEIDIDEKVLTIKDTSDREYPTIKIDTTKFEADNIWVDSANITTNKVVGQGETIKLPVVYVHDELDKALSLNVMYYIGSPINAHGAIDYKSPSGKDFYYDDVILEGDTEATEVQVIDGGSIVTSETGVYYVVYTATDIAGNTNVMYFTFEVTDTSNPILSVETVGDDITISGNSIQGGKGSVIDFETTLRSADGKDDYTNIADIKIKIDDNGKGLNYQPNGNSRSSYAFNDYGTYIVRITGEYKKMVGGVEKTFTADEKIINVNITKQEIKWLGEFDVPEYAVADRDVKLPDIAASNNAVVKVTVTDSQGNTPKEGEAKKETDINGFTYWTFKTNKDQKTTYTVTYTATNNEDVLTKTFKIKVGDNVAPSMEYNKGQLIQDLIYDGTNAIDYIVTMDKAKKQFTVKVINNGKEIYNHNIGLKITDKDDIGDTNGSMSWSDLSYELTGASVTKGETTSNTTTYKLSSAGKYTLTLKVKDSSENERVETIEFNVVTKSSVKENKDNVIGAVLIIISLVLLAGVILFFTFTGKKGGSAKAKKVKSSKNVKSSNNEKTEVIEEKEEVESVEEEKTEIKEEVKEEIAEETQEVKTEEVETQEEVSNEDPIEENAENSDEEPKTGEVE